MLFEAKIPKILWNETAFAGVFILNRSPTRSLSPYVTPIELWDGNKPYHKKLKVFGCMAYVWIPHQNRTKLDSKSKHAVMVGYAPNGYRLWDPEKQKVFTAREVKFEELKFPFKNK